MVVAIDTPYGALQALSGGRRPWPDGAVEVRHPARAPAHTRGAPRGQAGCGAIAGHEAADSGMGRQRMNGRERILAALDGQAPDRVPLALSFYHVDGAALAPPGAWRDDLVDVGFVEFPVSTEEEELRRRALPYDGDTRLGSAVPGGAIRPLALPPRGGAGRPTRWSRADAGRPRALPVPRGERRPTSVDGLARQVADLHARAGGRRQHAPPRRRALRGGLAPARPGELPARPRRAQGDGALPARPARRARPPQRRRPSRGPAWTSSPSTTTSGCRAR